MSRTTVTLEPDTEALVRRATKERRLSFTRVNDAHVAALAVEHGAEIVSFDRDFGRFPGVRVVVPGSA